MSSASNANWTNASNPVFKRGYDSLFGFNNNTGNSNSNNGSRAVVVCGAGLLHNRIF